MQAIKLARTHGRGIGEMHPERSAARPPIIPSATATRRLDRRFVMKYVRLAMAVALMSGAAGQRLLAQPILDRVEKQVRDQVDAAKAPVAAPPPAARGGEPGYLGLLADDTQDAGHGVRIVEIVPTGPAAKAGLRTGDTIVSIDGLKIQTMDDVARAMQGKTEGAKLMIAVSRAMGDETHEVTLGRRPQAPGFPKLAGQLRQPPSPAPGAAQQGPRLGLRTVPVSDEVRQRNNLNNSKGAVVVSLTDGGPAERAGIPVSAVIVAIDGGAVE
ncbi:MAG TPA: PDZ domain-containing protein, partial [Pirellulales bacterium]|nr:PDZ domain-containing protein [Pirellulales bacterium]